MLRSTSVMERRELTVRGEGAGGVPRALAEFAPDDRFDYDGDGFAVVTEQFFYRVLASLQTTCIFDLVDDATVDITLVAGGGAAGLAKHDLDAEGEALRKHVRQIERFCRENDLEVKRR